MVCSFLLADLFELEYEAVHDESQLFDTIERAEDLLVNIRQDLRRRLDTLGRLSNLSWYGSRWLPHNLQLISLCTLCMGLKIRNLDLFKAVVAGLIKFIPRNVDLNNKLTIVVLSIR